MGQRPISHQQNGPFSGLRKIRLQIIQIYLHIWQLFWEKIDKTDKTESKIFNANNAEQGNYMY